MSTMQNDHVPIREIGGTTATRVMTFARQLALEYNIAPDPHLVAQAPKFAAYSTPRCATNLQSRAGILPSQWAIRR